MFEDNKELGIQEISCQNLKDNQNQFTLIDVRRDEEYTGELGHISDSELVTLGPDLETKLNALDKNQSYVFICRSGGRSGQATAYAKDLGFQKVYNMQGGMLEWNRLQLPIES